MKRWLSPSVFLRVVAASLLFWASSRHGSGYYILLRWTVCAAGWYLASTAVNSKRLYWAWTFGIIAFLFNPLIRIRLDKAMWQPIDMAVGIVFLVSVLWLRVDRPTTEGGTRREIM